MNIEKCTTFAESSFRNGIVEYHSLIVAEVVEKMLEDEKCVPEVTLAWAVNAEKTLQYHSGNSPNDLVFKSNINAHSVLTDWLSAFETATTSNMVRIKLNALHAARKSFMEAESSKKILTALRSNVRTCGRRIYRW